MRYIAFFGVFALLVGAAAACAQKPAPLPTVVVESTSTPARPTPTPAALYPGREGWERASFARAGLDPGAMETFRSALRGPAYANVHSVVIVKRGRLVFKEYLGDYSPDRRQELASVTKSVTSILVGMAMEQGHLSGLAQGGLDQPIAALLPEYGALVQADPAKKGLLLRHVMSMSAGLEWDEETVPYGTPGNDCYETEVSRDSAGYVLAKPVVEAPGAVFEYNGGLSNLLSAVVQERTGLHMAAFADRFLSEPLGIVDYQWEDLADGRADAAGGLWLRPRDMAKIGQLMLDGGQWQGAQIVSREWVAESTRLHIGTGQGPDYGLQWWRGTLYAEGQQVETFFASGYGGQAIYVVPSLELVAVFTQRVYDNPLGTLRGPAMLTGYILPAALQPLASAEPPDPGDIDLDRLAGEFRSRSGERTLTILREGERLYLVHPDVGKLALTPQSASSVHATFMDVLHLQMVFADQNPAHELTVYMDFRTERYERSSGRVNEIDSAKERPR